MFSVPRASSSDLHAEQPFLSYQPSGAVSAPASGEPASSWEDPPDDLNASVFDENPITEVEVTLTLLAQHCVRIAEEGLPLGQIQHLDQPAMRRAFNRLSLA